MLTVVRISNPVLQTAAEAVVPPSEVLSKASIETKLILRKPSVRKSTALAVFAGVTDEDHRKYFTGTVSVEVTPHPPHSFC